MISKTAAIALFGAIPTLTLAIAVPAVAQDQRERARMNFEQADANKDGRLDLAEFTTFINLNADQGLGRAPTIRRFGRYAQAFTTLDTNKDGFVSREEIAAQVQE
jgi:Ca2+-binding EF-hand superfamily protein